MLWWIIYHLLLIFLLCEELIQKPEMKYSERHPIQNLFLLSLSNFNQIHL